MVYSVSSYSSLPSKAGVYRFLSGSGNVLYVGKAVDLKSRVSSYFVNPGALGEKTKAFVGLIKKIKITIVESELEALLLEAFYIKKHKPKYNIRLTDNKSYIRIKITNKEKYPSVTLVRREEDPGAVYFGPYPSTSSVKVVLKTIRRIFPYISVRNHPKGICLYNHLGLCPCPSNFDSNEERKVYKKNIRNIIRILEGQSRKIMKELEKERDTVSKGEQYEEALKIQKKIDALSLITTPFHTPFEYDLNPNLRVDIREKEIKVLREILNVHGLKLESLSRIECYDISNLSGTNATGSMVVFINGEKEGSQYRKFRIRKGGKPNDFAMMKEVLTRRLKHTEWKFPNLIIVDGGKGQVSSALEILTDNNLSIPLIGLAKREETIVIPILNSKFKYPNTKQIPTKNVKNIKHFEDLNLENSKIVSDFGFRASNLSFGEVSLPKNSPSLHLIMRIRDEAHRFAISYHKKLRSKSALI